MVRPGHAHLPGLDALRGVAAFGVVLLHAGYVFGLSPFASHGYLAVDFFFMLSGFVLANAYEARLRADLGNWRLIAMRIRRLYPLVILGVILGTLGSISSSAPGEQVAFAVAGGLLLIPHPFSPALDIAAFPALPPLWSLFWEMVASIVFATELFACSLRRLTHYLVSAFVLLLLVGWRYGTLNTGSDWASLIAGGPRVAFAFIAGMILFRLHPILRPFLGRPSLGLLAVILAGTMAPALPAIHWAYDVLVVTTVFPLIVVLAVAPTTVARPWRVGGDLSYALYVVHIPILTMVGLSTVDIAGLPRWAAAGAGIVLAVIVAWLADRFWDRPVRRWLSQVSGTTGVSPRPLPERAIP